MLPDDEIHPLLAKATLALVALAGSAAAYELVGLGPVLLVLTVTYILYYGLSGQIDLADALP